MEIASTPKDTIFRDGTASLYHFRPQDQSSQGALDVPFLLVPSMINRWYVLDLRPKASLAEAMVAADINTYLLDWGIPNDEDRYLNWEMLLERFHRMVRRVKRETGAKKVALLGYCMGGTLSSIYAALHPEEVAGFVSLTAPIDFSKGGLLRTLVDEKWFDPFAMTAPGNLSPPQMDSGFTSLRPTGKISKWVMLADKWHKPGFMDSFNAMEKWTGDNIPFPAEAYQTYIGELYQKNALYKGEHYVGGKHAHLSHITCPILNVVASRDNICPPDAALPLNELVSSEDIEVLQINGGHVGAVVGSKAPKQLYPGIADWLKARFARDQDAKKKSPEPLKPAAPIAPVAPIAAVPDEPLSRHDELMSMTAGQLRTMLRKRDLSPSGNKPELVGRLIDAESTAP